MSGPMWLRRLVRPLIPDRVMARYRLRQHSRQVRVNVDVFLPRDARSARRRWLAATPDTYRVRAVEDLGPPPPATRVAPGAAPPTTGAGVLVVADADDDAARAVALLADPDLDAGIVAEVAPPRLVDRQRAEPALAPRAVAVRAGCWTEIGGLPPGAAPLSGLVQRLRGAGARLGVVPVSPAGASPHRTDPIEPPAAVILALVPQHDVGGGSRGAQLAAELLVHGFHVTYAALYGTAESVDLGLRFVHPHLEQVRLTDLDPDRLLARFTGGGPALVIAEAPTPEIVRRAAALRRGGFRIVYDLIDDWTAPELGGDWYRPAVEAELVEIADALVASAPDLAAALERRRGPVTLVPNAVNVAIFGGEPGPVPDDFPPGGPPVLGYHGSLYGDWFDWAALAEIAALHAGSPVVVLGDVPAHVPALPPNVHLLGLKPQTELHRYVSRFDVGLIPFRLTDVTHAVSPLKAYEYLAMGVPVAAPPLRSLRGLPGVHTATPLPAAVTAARAAPPPDRAAVLAAHSWEARLAQICGAAGLDLPPATAAAVLIVTRPVTHHDRAARDA